MSTSPAPGAPRAFGPETLIEPLCGPLAGEARVPGDKSISHRAVIFAAMAEGTSRLTGVLDSQDVRSSIGAVHALGAAPDLAVQPDGSLAPCAASPRRS